MSQERMIYNKNPLVEVIIQYRFPKILALNTNDPIDFQEKIRDDYPVYQLAIENQQEINLAINPENTMLPLSSIIQKQPVKNHNFISQDGKYKINLTNEFISISTLAYHRWEEMISHFRKPLAMFEDIYKPPFYERIGLRYIDAYSRKELNLNNTPWSELIKPCWIGAAACTKEEELMINSSLDVEYFIEDKTTIAKIHTGLGIVNNNPERVFIVDSDFIKAETIKPESGFAVLEYLHNKATDFISQVVTEKLHVAMEPVKAE